MVGPCNARPRLQSLGFGDPIVGFAEVHSVSQLVGGSGSLQCCRASIELLPKSPCAPFFFEPAKSDIMCVIYHVYYFNYIHIHIIFILIAGYCSPRFLVFGQRK